MNNIKSFVVQNCKLQRNNSTFNTSFLNSDKLNNNDISTIKPQDIVSDILDNKGDMIRLNKQGYGYRLSYKQSENTLCFIKKEQDQQEEIITKENNLTQSQLQDALEIFKNVNGYFKKILKVKYRCK